MSYKGFVQDQGRERIFIFQNCHHKLRFCSVDGISIDKLHEST